MSIKLFSKIKVDLGTRSYPISIGNGLLHDKNYLLKSFQNRQVVLVTNDIVGPLHSKKMTSFFKNNNIEYMQIVLPDGEKNKSFTILITIFDEMLTKRINRDAVLVALGGGVIGDMAGFAAACFQRGIDFVQIPTTLLSQVDSSVGGKTAVNHELGKNMIGAFYQPKEVIIDIETLETLPNREFHSGLAEIIKYGCIVDSDFFIWIEKNIHHLLDRSSDTLAHAIKKSCEIKAKVVELDEKENGKRALLNFGHTFGHAIENGYGYGHWLHGEAVGCGIVMASKLSVQLGLISKSDESRVTRLIELAGLPTVWPDWPKEKYFKLMSNDKKIKNKTIHYVVLEKIGQAKLLPVNEEIVTEALF